MKYLALISLMVAVTLDAQPPANAPAGSTGICRDGTYTTASARTGACTGHKGIQTWYVPATSADKSFPNSMPPPIPATNTPSVPAPAPSPQTPRAMPAPIPAATSSSISAPRPSPAALAAAKPQAPGGAHGLVWLNSGSNVYHCYGSDFYGRTKAGAYMPEADAKAKGAHGARNVTCEGK